jgi:hypothetical protein
MPSKSKHKPRISIEIDDILINEDNNMVVSYSGYYRGNKVISGEYEFLETPKTESDLQEKILNEILSLVKVYESGVKH